MKVVVFDCFGVFYIDGVSHTLEREADNYEAIAERVVELTHQADRGWISQDEWECAVAELSGLSKDAVHAIAFDTQRNQALLDYVQTLRTRGYRVAMLSNVARGVMNTLFSDEEMDRFFDTVVLSGEVGVIKPQPEIYQIALDRLGAKPEQAIFIDDRQDNCDGAEAVGMQAVRYRNNAQTIRAIDAFLGAK